MARKNNRKHYHSRWLSDDLYKLTKKNKVSVAASISPTPTTSVAPKATHQNITPLREKDTPMETHTPAATPAALSPRPAKPQGMDDPRITRGSVWFADLAPRTTSNLVTSVQSGTRPVLVISNDLNNRFGTVITIIPFTGAPKRLDMPTHVAVIPSDVRNGYMPSEIYESTLLCEQITALDKSRLVSYVGSVVNPDLMNRVEQALLTQIGITSHSTNNSPSEEVRNHVQS